MGKYKENPKYYVISMRVNDEEMCALEELMRKCNKSITLLMREAIELYTTKLEMRSVQRLYANYQVLDEHILPCVLLSRPGE